jgi:hypothetical protein
MTAAGRHAVSASFRIAGFVTKGSPTADVRGASGV